MKVYLGSDHRGFKLKEKIFQFLVDENYDVEDYGAYEFNKTDDYTLYAEKVGSLISDKDRDTAAGPVSDSESLETRREGLWPGGGRERGILLCGSGVGVDVVANKFDGVRASIGKTVEQVKAGRTDDDMNVLVIAADFTSEGDAKKMVKAFLKTKFSGKKRFKRRLEDISRIEANN